MQQRTVHLHWAFLYYKNIVSNKKKLLNSNKVVFLTFPPLLITLFLHVLDWVASTVSVWSRCIRSPCPIGVLCGLCSWLASNQKIGESLFVPFESHKKTNNNYCREDDRMWENKKAFYTKTIAVFVAKMAIESSTRKIPKRNKGEGMKTTNHMSLASW